MTRTQDLFKDRRQISPDVSGVGHPIRDGLIVALAVVVQVLLIVGFIAMSLGLGVAGHGGVGPDRPPIPAPDPAHPSMAMIVGLQA
jgi:hypothetical protein